MQSVDENIRVRLKTRRVDYGPDCRPVDPSAYSKFDRDFKSRPTFDIWEAVLMNGRSWLGVVADDGETTVEGRYQTYLHRGSYDRLMELGKQVGRDHPDLVEFYLVYLNSPEEVAEPDLQTRIVFRTSLDGK